MRLPKISIITIVFNNVDVILDALNSVKDQTYSGIEHIVIDGGSTDGTAEIVGAFPFDESILINEPDEGIYDALNKGLKLATGDVIGVLHSDDVFADEHVISDVAKEFSCSEVDAVYGDLVYVMRDNVDIVARKWRSCVYNDGLLRKGWMPPHPTLFLRNDVIKKCGKFDPKYRISADYDFILRCFSSEIKNSRYIPNILVKMRIGGVSNRSLSTILLKMREDYLVLRKNRVGGIFVLLRKNLRKLSQLSLCGPLLRLLIGPKGNRD
ncbi:MAG: glycosyltransferase family 2 protein [Porticoccaceae bacterium]|nr:glycosyltransferase family 2 protein [Porticoccaceae bacterium]